MTETLGKWAVWTFLSIMLVILVGAIPMAIWRQNELYLLGLFALVFFAV